MLRDCVIPSTKDMRATWTSWEITNDVTIVDIQVVAGKITEVRCE
jgi:hypothetical protein